MNEMAPPPLLHACRVLPYAVVDSGIRFARKSVLHVDGKALGPSPRLVVGRNLVDGEAILLHCDDRWNVLGASGSGSVDDVLAQANRLYDGIESRWIDLRLSDVDFAKALADEFAEQRCSFCGKYHFELGAATMVSGRDAAICSECVARLHAVIAERGAAAPLVGN